MKTFVVVAVLFGGAVAAHRMMFLQADPDRIETLHPDHFDRKAPEIDPSAATGALALLSGGLLVIRGRRKRL